MQAQCCGRWVFHYELHHEEGMSWCPTCMSTAWGASEGCQWPCVCGDAHAQCDKPHIHNPNEPPAAAAYPWRHKRAIDEAIAPPPKRGNAPLRGMVEQCSTDGSCFLAVFPGLQEKVVVYQQDILGVPTAGQSIEAWIFV